MIDTGVGEAVAHREPRLPPADHDRLRTPHVPCSPFLTIHDSPDPIAGGRPLASRRGPAAGDRGQAAFTATSTGTPLVSTSNTAERARDCSTISRSLSAGASPLMSNVARIFW